MNNAAIFRKQNSFKKINIKTNKKTKGHTEKQQLLKTTIIIYKMIKLRKRIRNKMNK